jgi:hypothetical protein
MPPSADPMYTPIRSARGAPREPTRRLLEMDLVVELDGEL